MPRVMIRGGVWKNTEDEILKAAVMKYGKNQWGRISSLFPRKSAKQCKLRWHEWLDPSIKKTEWSREEEEKLLHLAKLMPNQWRTIAPMVGRTAYQCLEHYEKLLDAVQEKEDDTEDPRKLRPGEIDPAPETKPARPDPVDMDEDEKEMLSEARARLANTKGKKAKRRAREKQLEEARRLAVLQKKRELKAAGIQMPQYYRRRWRGGVDYAKEIPFQKDAPAGYYDTTEEIELSKKQDPKYDSLILEKMEGRRRADIEADLRKKDAKRHKEMKAKDPAKYAMMISKLNEPEVVQKRTKLSLPAPQVTDAELAEIAKLEMSGRIEQHMEGAGAASASLLSNYAAATPTPGGATPAVAARTPLAQGNIVKDVQDLISLQSSQTPLLGGENVALHGGVSIGGATPQPRVKATPNTVVPASPYTAGSTPRRGGRTPASGATPFRTPLRDEMGINVQQDGQWAEMSEIRSKGVNTAKNLLADLKALPKPKHDYDVVIPSAALEEEEGEEKVVVPDARDIEDEERELQMKEKDLQFKLFSHPIQRGLPRPSVIPTQPSDDSDDPLTQAHTLLQEELRKMVLHDAVAFPHPSLTPTAEAVAVYQGYDQFELSELQQAAVLIAEEQTALKTHQAHDVTPETFAAALAKGHKDLIFNPAEKRYARANIASRQEKIAAAKEEHACVTSELEQVRGRNAKLEKRLEVTMKGYLMRARAAQAKVETASAALATSRTDGQYFAHIQQQETTAIAQRIRGWETEVDLQKGREKRLQHDYATLQRHVETLQKLLA
eukprot:GCRY01000980.1.p1 GENE.GCRY01000980.1~~GCRY01000980.1.p1  ORF type:complete len:780 (+),score=289.55 GCRY01000980.1:276-2615(+)